MNRLRKFAALPQTKKLCLLEGVFLVTVLRLTVLIVPFRIIADWIGNDGNDRKFSHDPANFDLLRNVKWAVRTAFSNISGDRRCLVQALTAYSMLRRRGIPGTIFYGLTKDESGKLKAHAWLRSGDWVITGARSRHQYSVVSSHSFEGKV